jgi:hypothetical protein
MRHLVRIAVFFAVGLPLPVAFAQSDSGAKAGAYTAGPPGQPPPGFRPDQLNPTNCGTPDEPKSCGPVHVVHKMKRKSKAKSTG